MLTFSSGRAFWRNGGTRPANYRLNYTRSYIMLLMDSTPAVLVTGASRGLGRGIAQACSRCGFDVAIHYSTNRGAALETVSLCQSQALNPLQRFVPVAGDIAVAADRAALIDCTLRTFGRLDALVNNAGIATAFFP